MYVPVEVGPPTVPEATPDGCELGRAVAVPVGSADVLDGGAEVPLEATDSVGRTIEVSVVEVA